MRVIAFVAALIAVYMWRRSRGTEAAVSPSRMSFVALALACLLALWSEQVVSDWAGFWHRDIFEWLPLAAGATGAAVGYIIADQQLGYEGTVAADVKSAAVDRLSFASKCFTANLALAVLVIIALLPPQTVGEMLTRVQGVKAGAVELTLAVSHSAELAKDIRAAAPPRPVDTSLGSGITERTGFIPVRLGMMQSYTYPPKLGRLPGTASAFTTPDSYILSSPVEPALVDPLPVVRQVQRDRALAWKIETLHTQYAHYAVGGSSSSQEITLRPPSWMKTLGQTQEEFLNHIAPHIVCLSDFVRLTKNRRLLEYQNYRIVEHLFAIAHLWSAAEKSFAFDQTDQASQGATGKSRINTALAERMESLANQFRGFGRWANDFLSVWNARPDVAFAAANPDKESSLARCGNQEETASKLESFARELKSKDDAELRLGWFSPYVTVFVAQTLSAMGDHASAVELLVQWISDLDDIEDHGPEASNTQYQLLADWYRVQVLDAVLTLQRLSEGSDVSIPQQVQSLRSLVRQYFPKVLQNMGETASMPNWRGSSSIACVKAENQWKQPIVLSYATWIKQYLDVVTRSASRPEDVSAEDLELSDILEQISMACFPDFLGGKPAKARFLQAEQHLQFVTTATAARYYKLTLGHQELSDDDKRRLRARTEASLRSAMLALERAQGDTEASDGLREMIYGTPGTDLLVNARSLQKRLEEIAHTP